MKYMAKNGVTTVSIIRDKNGYMKITLPSEWRDDFNDAICARLERQDDGIKLTPIR